MLMYFSYQTAVFRVRPIIPCVITNITFQVDIPDDDEIQVNQAHIQQFFKFDKWRFKL